MKPKPVYYDGAKRPKNVSFKLFWYSLYIFSPNVAHELAL